VKEVISIHSDSDMQGATAALIRSAKKARELAARTRTEFVVIRDGVLVREIPEITPVSESELPDSGLSSAS
jgi:hypothetical protein